MSCAVGRFSRMRSVLLATCISRHHLVCYIAAQFGCSANSHFHHLLPLLLVVQWTATVLSGRSVNCCSLIMAKRPLTFEDTTPKKHLKQDSSQTPISPTNINSPSSNATVHALIASVSPLKPSRYFDGEITDGESITRIVGFDKAQRQLLLSFCDRKVANKLPNSTE
ncbi:hypothetical protein GBAR_LOCUS30803 [Geodia barretti]|uniref:Uncharacterized protein n=1 Tax=Geodia barretti TaxID=519541 RepID=A0AA35TXX3_GEOBA|nr:hypothetical protein GBAR_LOCUS30803 [Geodia barretti]